MTGEASPAYVYSAAALRFFAQPNLKLARVVLLLREPAGAHASSTATRATSRAAAAGPATRRSAPPPPPRSAPPPRRAGAVHGVRGVRGLWRSGGRGGRGGGAACNGSALEVPPVLWRSWYHLFLPRWIETLRGRVAVAFSDELFGDAAALLARLGAFLQLPPRAYNTSLAYNTALRRGLAGDAAVPAAAAREEHERRAAQARRPPAAAAAPRADGALGRRDRRAPAPRPPRRRPRRLAPPRRRGRGADREGARLLPSTVGPR